MAAVGIWACSDATGAESQAQDSSLPQLNIQLNTDPGNPPAVQFSTQVVSRREALRRPAGALHVLLAELWG